MDAFNNAVHQAKFGHIGWTSQQYTEHHRAICVYQYIRYSRYELAKRQSEAKVNFPPEKPSNQGRSPGANTRSGQTNQPTGTQTQTQTHQLVHKNSLYYTVNI